jgi:hypothetical protein
MKLKLVNNIILILKIIKKLSINIILSIIPSNILSVIYFIYIIYINSKNKF